MSGEMDKEKSHGFFVFLVIVAAIALLVIACLAAIGWYLDFSFLDRPIIMPGGIQFITTPQILEGGEGVNA